MLVWLPDEEDLAVRRVGRRGGDHEQALLLLDAARPEEVTRGLHPERAVAVRGQNVGGMEDCHRSRGQLLRQPAAVGDEEGGVDRRVSHAWFLRYGQHCGRFAGGRKAR